MTESLRSFQLPIQYYNPLVLSKEVVDDLELKLLYSNVLYDIQSKYSQRLEKSCIELYTTNTTFLKDHQLFLKDYRHISITKAIPYYNIWNEFYPCNHFKEKYQYIEWGHLERCNHSSSILQLLSFCNLSSPFIMFISPIFMFIVPFFILSFASKNPLTLENYLSLLKEIMKHHAFGRIFSGLSSNEGIQKNFSAFCFLLFYLSSVYQNILSCIRFYRNIDHIKRFLYDTKIFLKTMDDSICECIEYMNDKDAFKPFIIDIQNRQCDIRNLYNELNHLDKKSFRVHQLLQIGNMMKLFYTYQTDIHYIELIEYCFDVLCYIHYLNNLHVKIQGKFMKPCKFDRENTIMHKQYYLYHMFNKKVKNNVKLNKNMIITGPNASGKTTILKSVMINQIISQQVGYGCYNSSTKIKCYDTFFSYLNIPDTCKRDSLFQAEARRCLNIINYIQSHPKENIYIIFDELYSGTNPEEAVISSKVFIQYMTSFKITFMVTTHYIDICKSVYRENIRNMQMEAKKHEDFMLDYTYKIIPGISTVKAGVLVLKELGYPEEMIQALQTESEVINN